MKPKKKDTRGMSFRFTEEQFEAFNQARKNTLCRTKSEYAKKLLLGMPVTMIYRNRSLDDFIEASVKIRKELKVVLTMGIFTPEEKDAFQTALNEIINKLIQIIKQCPQI
jgi:hypothetical protein